METGALTKLWKVVESGALTKLWKVVETGALTKLRKMIFEKLEGTDILRKG